MHARGLDHVVWAVRDLDAAAAHLERLGFTVTPRARHPWGTENRLVQLNGFFIEVLTVGADADIPAPSDTVFSFGAHNRDFLARGEGASMLVTESRDPAADRAAFARAGLAVFEPFSFEREQRRADGSVRKVGFDLTFTRDPDDPALGFFTCFNRYPENFWSPEYQAHANGVRDLAAVVIVCEDPADHHIFYSAFTGVREMRATSLGITISTPRGDVRLMPRAIYRSLFGEEPQPLGDGKARVQALVFGAGARDAVASACARSGIESLSTREGLVVPARGGHGLSLVFP
ncbi:VOC family protein [Stappia sp.]|uniref:VOC family protein n=1 Tax=Stappia sp. TaxID=1870903 RepID=UPI0032D934D9